MFLLGPGPGACSSFTITVSYCPRAGRRFDVHLFVRMHAPDQTKSSASAAPLRVRPWQPCAADHLTPPDREAFHPLLWAAGPYGQSWNRYGYSLGDPVNANDPGGTDATNDGSDCPGYSDGYTGCIDDSGYAGWSYGGGGDGTGSGSQPSGGSSSNGCPDPNMVKDENGNCAYPSGTTFTATGTTSADSPACTNGTVPVNGTCAYLFTATGTTNSTLIPPPPSSPGAPAPGLKAPAPAPQPTYDAYRGCVVMRQLWNLASNADGWVGVSITPYALLMKRLPPVFGNAGPWVAAANFMAIWVATLDGNARECSNQTGYTPWILQRNPGQGPPRPPRRD